MKKEKIDFRKIDQLLYLGGTILGIVSFYFSFKDSIDAIHKKKKVNISIIVSYYILSISLFMKIPYLKGKLLSEITAVVWGVGFMITAILYTYAHNITSS